MGVNSFQVEISKDTILPYINEIITNARLAILLLDVGDKSSTYDFKKVQCYSLGVTTASVILQIIDLNLAKKPFAKRRVKIIEKYYPNIPSAPKNLRKVRNHIQHFDERMDDWFFGSLEKNKGYGIIIDKDKNIECFSSYKEYGNQYERRLLEDNQFSYWGHQINIFELKKWCLNIIEHFS